ncbi:hypothetical protein AB0467_27995 [Streptomyces sp. NPDC052095]|uniref:hypothetical protein n=1 Tax=unclassified Streptomyces TaxID=2593676 RepID=UPI00344D186B
MTGRTLPAPEELTWDQATGRACIWCRQPLTTGAVHVGTIHDRQGAHVLDVEAWSCPCCASREQSGVLER